MIKTTPSLSLTGKGLVPAGVGLG